MGEAGIAQWLERRTRDWKVAGSNPCRSGGGIFFSRSTFCADSYFGIRYTPCYFYMVGSYPVFTRLALSWLFHGLPCILIISLKFVSFYYHTNHHWGVSSFSLMLLYFCHAPFHSTQTRHQDGIFVLENAELLFSSTCMVKHSIRTVNHRGNCASQVVYSIPQWDKCSILIDDRLYSAILRSLEQTHCARLWFYMSDKLFLFFFSFSNIHRSGVLKRWHGWCRMKLQPSRRKFCVHHTTMHHVTSCKATYVRCMRV